ncbi:MAG: acyl-phosphate glycerol-3-phosphate acyltransferase [Candidatus Eremiobacteraeota bacterium]|jgi:glycerol-3-phosphate acyltransferase PlsY|nr:acyl-phosphate glycerol-3-phosphate acyltransferase [Candidatus Eremiobacteraeota bacterium]
MSEPLISVAAVVVAFAVGSIPFGVLVSRAFYGTDIRKSGSGNIGAANALRTLGKRGAVAVLALDALKGFAPTLAAGALGGPVPAALAAFASVAGHCWSPFLGFKGGKGVATFLGATIALWWPAGIAFGIVWVAAVIACGYASVGSMLASLAMAPVLWFGLGRIGLVYGLVAAVLIIYRHQENLDRLRHGTENRLSLLKAPRQS